MNVANDKVNIDLRRYTDMMSVVGIGIVLFGFWSFIKTSMYLYLTPRPESTEISQYPEYVLILLLIAVVLLTVAGIMDFLIRIHVGVKAIRARRKRTVEKPGLASVVFLAVVNSIALILDLVSYFADRQDLLDHTITTFIDLTSLILIFEMLYAAVRIRKILKEKHAA